MNALYLRLLTALTDRDMAAWLYEHPRAHRAFVLLWLLWAGWLVGLLCAPRAAASAGAAGLAWTGLHDSYGVPVGAHVVATVPLLEALGNRQGAEFGVQPESWGPALADTGQTVIDYTWLSGVLAAESAVLAFLCAVGIWLVKFALSAVWMAWLAALARPVVANINATVGWLAIEAGMALVCFTIGAVVALTRGIGRGLGIMFGGLLIAVLSWVVLRDPVGTELDDNGVLATGRNLGFTLAQGVANNGPVGSSNGAGLDRLTSQLVDVLVRQQIQQLNFGKVIDTIPGCGQAYSAALVTPGGDPVTAVGRCAPDALLYAQSIDGGTAGFFALLILVVAVVMFAVTYVGLEVVRVGFKAFFHLLGVVAAAPFAIPPGPARRVCQRLAVRLAVFGVEMVVATAGLGVLIIMLAHVSAGALPGVVGMDSPVAKLFLMALIGVFGAVGFRFLLRGFGDRGMAGPVRTWQAVSGGAGRVDDARQRFGRSKSDEREPTRQQLIAAAAKNPQLAAVMAGLNATTLAGARPGRKAHPAAGSGKSNPPPQPSGKSRSNPPQPSGPGPGRSGTTATGQDATQGGRMTEAPNRTQQPPGRDHVGADPRSNGNGHRDKPAGRTQQQPAPTSARVRPSPLGVDDLRPHTDRPAAPGRRNGQPVEPPTPGNGDGRVDPPVRPTVSRPAGRRRDAPLGADDLLGGGPSGPAPGRGQGGHEEEDR